MDKKAKKKKQREQKKKQARRDAARSPFEKFDAPPRNLRCLVNEDWDAAGLVELLVRRDLAHGILAFAEFKVALEVAGLTLAQGMLDYTEAEWNEVLDEYRDRGVKLVPMPADQAAAFVAAGVRIAREYGFRVPEKWDKWAKIFTLPLDLDNADLSHFDRGYYGSLAELQDRLIGSDLETFLRRRDLDIQLSEDALLEGEDAIREAPQPVLNDHKSSLELATEWAQANGQTPHPELPEASRVHMLALFKVMAEGFKHPNTRPSKLPGFPAALESTLQEIPADRQSAVREALAQYQQWLDGRDDD